MFGVKKILMRRMSNKRWTTRDKISQYKGIISLYNRNKKVLRLDAAYVKKNQQRLHKEISKDLAKKRRQLDVATKGNLQELRNCLQIDRRLLLGYQNLPIHEIIEHIHQDTFSLRKALDQLLAKIKVKTQKLINLKLDILLYQDILTKVDNLTTVETHCKIITAQLQDAILHRDAAIHLGTIYTEIIHCMKKDLIFQNAAIDVLESDHKHLRQCIYKMIKLGQLATEKLADTKVLCNDLEMTIKQHMISRETELNNAMLGVKWISRKVTSLPPARRESSEMITPADIDLRTSEEIDELVNMKSVVKALQETTKTTTVSDMLACFETQLDKERAILNLSEKLYTGKNSLQTKLHHERSSLNYLIGTMDAYNAEYETEKVNLETQIDHTEKKLMKTRKRLTSVNSLCVKLNTAIMGMNSKCNVSAEMPVRNKLFSNDELKNETHTFLHTFDQLYAKVVILVQKTTEITIGEITDEAQTLYINYLTGELQERIPATLIQPVLADVFMEDAAIPTRECIKEASYKITAQGKALKTQQR